MNEAFIAVARFGYGAGPNDNFGIGNDPRGWLKAQLDSPALPAAFNGLPEWATLFRKFQEARRSFVQATRGGRRGKLADSGDAQDGNGAGDKVQLPPELAALREAMQDDFQQEVGARVSAAVTSQTPLVERLVVFWANHFTVSGVRPVVRPIAGAYEREAIRPNLTGNFHDLLLAVVRHPAMGLYLDNAVSVGPDSFAGEFTGRGINENLGRELMELHTLGVNGGYTEDDVRALARILTGWTISRPRDPGPLGFRFGDRMHEPGEKVFLGKRIPDSGEQEGLEAIAMLANHPSTARHIAFKLARHFVADDPPPAVVDRLSAAFTDSGGNLRTVTEALIDSPEAWQNFGGKLKTPYDLVVSTSRALDVTLPPKQAMNSLALLGQPTFMAPSPAGWPDDAASWVGPEAILQRIDWLQTFAGRAPGPSDPRQLARVVLADATSADLDSAMTTAESRETALTLLLASPEFQRR
jgi:uncharacterized protein (DUF1800 family)